MVRRGLTVRMSFWCNVLLWLVLHFSCAELYTSVQEIHKQIALLNFHDCHAKIRQVDSQATVGDGVVIQVTLSTLLPNIYCSSYFVWHKFSFRIYYMVTAFSTGCNCYIATVQGPDYKKILRLSYDVIITYDNRKSNLR